ncbi:MAG: LLM class flavin-dependent oxidoreductase [Nitrospinota bacterium]|nr:LLM class flavin-dependent oxidoreductase [Nitrospinota bacterium]
MQFGLMLRSQYPLEDDLQVRFSNILEQVVKAEKLGFSSITKGSHYSTFPFNSFQQIPFLARICAEAPSLRFNAGIVLLPLHKPLDIAEQISTLDVITNGKIIFGAGLGYRDVEFKAFGTSKKDRVRRLEENLIAIKRLWTEEKVSMEASHFSLQDASCTPSPVQKPHPPIWIGANSDEGIKRAARFGDSYYVNPHNRIETTKRQLEMYKEELIKLNKPFPFELPMRREVFVAEDFDKAVSLCRPYLEKKYNSYHNWGQDQAMPEGDKDLSLDFDKLLEDRFIIGGPNEVSEKISELSSLGVNHLIMSIEWPGMPQSLVLDTMSILSEKVFPLVRENIL